MMLNEAPGIVREIGLWTSAVTIGGECLGTILNCDETNTEIEAYTADKVLIGVFADTGTAGDAIFARWDGKFRANGGNSHDQPQTNGGQPNDLPQPDRSQIETFVLTLFKHATAGNYVSLRTFPDQGGNSRPGRISAVRLNGKLGVLVDKATRDAELAAHNHSKGEQAKLKQARNLATRLVDGDTSNISIVHPIRWPGSLHRKGEPKLCRIVDCNPDTEINLDHALAILQRVAKDTGIAVSRSKGKGANNGPASGMVTSGNGQLAVFAPGPLAPAFQGLRCDLKAGLKTNFDELRAALSAIPPSAIADEPKWMRLARGLAWEARFHPDRTEALWEMLDTVSRQAPRYNEADNRCKFDRYISEADEHETPNTTQTIFHIALDHGWDGRTAAHHCSQFMEDCRAQGMTYQEAGAAILADESKAEWADRSWWQTRVSLPANSTAT